MNSSVCGSLVMVKGFPNPRGMRVRVQRVRVRVEIIEPSPNPYPRQGSGVTRTHCNGYGLRHTMPAAHQHLVGVLIISTVSRRRELNAYTVHLEHDLNRYGLLEISLQIMVTTLYTMYILQINNDP
jgi:hypothetical protein